MTNLLNINPSADNNLEKEVIITAFDIFIAILVFATRPSYYIIMIIRAQV